MTDRGFAVWLLVVLLLSSAGIGVSLVLSLLRPWRAAIRDQENGPRTAILRGAMRRCLISLLSHASALTMILPRLLMGHPAPTWLFALAMLTLIFSMMADNASAMFDLRLLRGLLKADHLRKERL